MRAIAFGIVAGLALFMVIAAVVCENFDQRLVSF